MFCVLKELKTKRIKQTKQKIYKILIIKNKINNIKKNKNLKLYLTLELEISNYNKITSKLEIVLVRIKIY